MYLIDVSLEVDEISRSVEESMYNNDRFKAQHTHTGQ